MTEKRRVYQPRIVGGQVMMTAGEQFECAPALVVRRGRFADFW
jgi:hypothetical protein